MFQTTRWSLVLAARDDTGDARAALEHLCRIYRNPVVVYVRRVVASPQDAEDLAQAFFLRFLEQRYHADADPARGKFRTFLLTALKRFLANAWDAERAVKRGGGAKPQALESDVLATLAVDAGAWPDREFERAFALAVLDNALKRLRAEAEDAGKGRLFDALHEFLIEPPEPARYAEVAAELGMRRNTVAVTVHRMRERLTELVRTELAETVSNPADVESEMRALRAALTEG
jgi:RNA polymerase sigma-70 factor (ECF subfamily)